MILVQSVLNNVVTIAETVLWFITLSSPTNKALCDLLERNM